MISQSTFSYGRRVRAGFTLIEMVVTAALLVILIAIIAVIFRTASEAAGTSQVMMEMLSNVRSTQQQIDQDYSGISRQGFLSIKINGTPGTNASDELAFLSIGHFPNRLGTSNSDPFTDRTAAHAAVLWYGLRPQNGVNWYLCRHTRLLVGGNPPMVSDSSAPNMPFSSLGTINQYPDPVLVVASPAEIYNTLMASGTPANVVSGWHGSGNNLNPDASLQFNTSGALGVTDVATMVTSYYSMQPVMLTGARELNIEWWKDKVVPPELPGWRRTTEQWYPWNATTSNAGTQNAGTWPRMLRVSVRLVDQDGRAGTDGRWFTQVLSIKD